MKYILILTVIMLFAFCCKAQTAFKQTVSNPTGAIANTSIDTLSLTLSASYNTVAIQPVVTKTSGTMAGTAILSSSVNGTNYVSSDTLTLANAATNTVIWNKTSPARYWRIIVGGATTVAGTAAAKVSASQ